MNLKLKWEIPSNIFIIGLDNIVEYSNRRNLINHTLMSTMNMGYTSDLNNTATKLSNSLYIYDTIKIGETFDVSLGARAELSNYWIENNQYFNFTPVAMGANFNGETDFNKHISRVSYATEITPNFKYSDTGNVYAKAELGFISPSAYQMINADSEGGKFNPSCTAMGQNDYCLYNNYFNNLKTEQYATGEIGWKDEFGVHFFSATAFYTHTFNEVYADTITHGTQYRYGNLGETQRAGVALIGKHRIGDSNAFRISEGISYTYTNVLKTNIANTYLKNKQVPYAPFLKVTFNVELDVLNKDNHLVSLFVNNAYISSSKAMACSSGLNTYGECSNANKYQIDINDGGYLLTDIGVNWRVGGFGLGAGIKNLFDKFYVVYQKDVRYIPAIGRNYFVELRYDF